MTKPRISVITPTLNAAATIENAILSVANQTYDQLEHWIIDGGSTDATLAPNVATAILGARKDELATNLRWHFGGLRETR